MNSVSFSPSMNAVNFGKAQKANNAPVERFTGDFYPEDTFSKAEDKESRQEIIKKAKTKAAGWSVFGGAWSALYYGLRSDKTIAKKFDLDPEADKAFIRQIRNEQVTATLPGAFTRGLGGVFNWIHHKTKDASKYEV